MRVIGGAARGVRLKRVPGDTTRPIMDRVKESLFNILGDPYVAGQRWLDLFAGTGQVGIEALSRGAAHVVFIDSARAAVAVIQDNLRATRLGERATVRHMDAFTYLGSTAELFDVIFVAPPQYRGVWEGALAGIDRRPEQLLNPSGIVVAQIDPREYQPLQLATLSLYRQRAYGNTLLCFYERAAEAPAAALTDC